MRAVTRHAWIAGLLWLLAGASGQAATIEIFDRVSGELLPLHEHKGRSYVEGTPGHEYEIRIRSEQPQRLLAVASVDGVNVISGETAAASQSGYVLEPYGFMRIEGWRKSLSRTAAFYFTKLPDSYAARTGRPDNVGVIGVALFRERPPCCAVEEQIATDKRERREASQAAQGTASAPSAEKRLGTGHGRNEYSAARYTGFERATDAPDEVVTIYYDSRRNLIARGIIPSPRHYADTLPQPFPGGFVADP